MLTRDCSSFVDFPKNSNSASPFGWQCRRQWVARSPGVSPKPTVILPSASLTWSLGDLKLALVHELSHIKRRDDVWMLVGSLATALYWFNPLVWLVRDRLTLEADNVCDGYVVNSGADSTVYARFMLAMARQCSAIRTPIAIGSEIFGKKQLEVRIMSIQNGSVRSHQVRRSLVRLAWVLTLSISIPVAAMRLSGSADTPKTRLRNPLKPRPSNTRLRIRLFEIESQPVQLTPRCRSIRTQQGKPGWRAASGSRFWSTKPEMSADARILKESGNEFRFDEAALDAAKKTTWKPAVQDGKKVAVWVSYQIKFQLRAKDSDAKSKN